MTSKAKANRAATPAAWLETDEQSARRIAGLFAESDLAGETAVALHDQGAGRWRVMLYFGVAPNQPAVRALTATAAGPSAAKALRFERIAAKDWAGASIAALRPVAAGRFVVHGAYDRARIPANRIGIEIEAALAFGTGHHGTTRGCLLALDRICKLRDRRRPAVRPHPKVRAKRTSRKPRILDLGTGSGVLAIAAARALRQHVLATDIDASAVRVARNNARLNGSGPMVEVLHADGVADGRLRAGAPFDVIVANILLRPLQRFAAPLQALAARGGRVVLSGLLASQANAVIAAYRGLALERRIELEGWTTLVFARPRRRQHIGVARRRMAP
jgi:ribosomal protein L11 methyltransferase